MLLGRDVTIALRPAPGAPSPATARSPFPAALPRRLSAGHPTADAPGATRTAVLRSPLAAERRKHQRPCDDPPPGTRGGVFTEKITDAGRVWRSSAAFTIIATCSPARGSPPALGVHPGADHLRAARHRLRPRPAQPGRHRPGGEVPPPPPTWMRHAMTSWPSPPSSRDLATRVWSSNPLERLNKEIRRLAMWPAYSRAGMPSSASPVPFLPSRKVGAMPGPDRLRLPGGPLRPGRITQGR